MTNGIVLSIDGMGGDHAPDIVVEGVDIFARSHPDVRFLVHGDAARLATLMDKHAAAKGASEIVPAEKMIGMEVKASQALRQGKGSSLWNAVQAVETGDAHAVVSAGNTGAYHGDRDVPVADDAGRASPGACHALADDEGRLHGDARRRRQRRS